MSRWLSSTNAKEIGTLYLVFAVFAGIQKITIMLALYLAVCWETLHKLNIKPVLELGKILYLKGLSAVNFLLRDFTQDNLNLFISFIFDNSVTYSYGHLSGELSPKTLNLQNNYRSYRIIKIATHSQW